LIPKINNIKQILEQPDNLLTISENSTATEATKKMNEYNVGCLVVLDSTGKFTGVLSERDMLVKILAESRCPDKILTKDIMSINPVFCKSDTTIAKVELLMAEHKIRHVPIVEKGIPIGMISSRDVIAYRLQSNKQMKNAAEQLAILLAKLKTHNLEDIIKLAINEAPQNFGSNWSALYLKPENNLSQNVYCNGCPLTGTDLEDPEIIKELSPDGWVICGKVCQKCEKQGAKAPRLVIPLSVHKNLIDGNETDLKRIGFLCMCRMNPSVAESEELQLYKASLLQEILNVNLTNARLYKEYHQVRIDSETDSLTGVGTRRVLERKLKKELSRSNRYNRDFCVAMFDADGFKEINDAFGHTAGDKVLRQLALCMQQSVRTIDTLTRYGGDEFVLLMPETKLEGAAKLLERIRVKIESSLITQGQTITISCGVTQAPQSPDETIQKILKRTDKALYEAKHSGKNRIVVDRFSLTKII